MVIARVPCDAAKLVLMVVVVAGEADNRGARLMHRCRASCELDGCVGLGVDQQSDKRH